METRKENPLRKANFINKFFFWWLKDFMRRGKKTNFKPSDIYDVMPEDLSEQCLHALEIAWEREKNRAKLKSVKPSLWRVIIRTYYKTFLMFASLQLAYMIVLFIQPLLLEKIMQYFDSTLEMPTWKAYVYATIYIILMVLSVVLFQPSYFRLERLGMQIKIALSSLIYKKMTKFPYSSTRCGKSASVISLLSIDVSRFEKLLPFLGYVGLLPFHLVGVTYAVGSRVGLIVSLIGVTLMILQTIPIQILYYKLILKWRANQATNTDNRIKLIDEIVNGVRLIKMYAWENYFEKLVCHARSLEIVSFLKISYLVSACDAFNWIPHRSSSFMVILICLLQYKKIKTAELLTVRKYFFNLRTNLCVQFSIGVKAITDTRVSIKRLEDFLCLPEVKATVKKIDDTESRGAILIKDVTAFWDETTKDTAVCNVTVEFLPGKLYVILGATGSGKSSLLNLILGELEHISGQVSVAGKISYASQEPWLFTASVRENILFGETYDIDRYQEVITACALLDDFNKLPYGDQTLVGDRGMSLSGGQRTRINLARAVYRQADVYLLDDIFSAVDTRVAKILRNQCVDKLLKDKTVILVTHNLHQLHADDRIILLKSGTIQLKGNISDLQSIEKYGHLLPSKGIDCVEYSKDLNDHDDDIKGDEWDVSKNNENQPSTERAEVSVEGTLSKSVFLKYVKIGGYVSFFIAVASNALYTLLLFKFDFDMTAWTEQQNYNLTNQSLIREESLDNLLKLPFVRKSMYIMAFIVVTAILKNIFIYRFSYGANKKLHRSMFGSLIKTPMIFFELNSAGRILNRFSDDIGNLDNIMSTSLAYTLAAIFEVLGALSFVLIINYWTIVPIALTTLLFLKISIVYIVAVPQIKRLVAIAKSPVLNFVTSTLSGLTTIRSCKAEEFVMKEFANRLDKHTAAFFLTIASSRALALWMEMITVALFACTAYMCIALKNHGIEGGVAGLTLTAVSECLTSISFIARTFAETCSQMICIERVLQYTELDSEDLAQNEVTNEITKSWPSRGEIRFERINLKYSDGPLVLKDLSFSIQPGTKVGIVGRTGAGKSSLITALFRLTKVDGQILIDNVDTQKADLTHLRSRISIIPQEPVIFTTSVRSNLDPLNDFDDSTLWSALDSVGLRKTFSSLDQQIAGKNLSSGQRQLLCLARVVAKNSKILVLDEATANLDEATDSQIQEIIRKKFQNCTVLTIAHRLNTIMDSEKVIVMDQGQLVEYDTPQVLLENIDGHFSKMVEQTGEKMSQKLRMTVKNV